MVLKRKRRFRSVVLSVLSCLVLGLQCANSENNNNCVPEFDTCVMNRDCCSGLSCVTGDWEVTTDSTCLSPRSQKLNEMDPEQQILLIQSFYATKVNDDKKKSPQDAKALAEKYLRTAFAQLVFRLEQKYGISVEDRSDKSEL